MTPESEHETRQRLLQAALERFAHRGYAGASVADIVAAARVTKPTLYYYFANKAAIYQALLDVAYDERLQLMRAAARRGQTASRKLVEVLTAIFEFLQENRALMRLAFATAFAAPGEIPDQIDYLKKSRRNFEFFHALLREGIAAGELDGRRDSKELALALYGMLNIHVMAELVQPTNQLGRSQAERIMALFLNGAAKRRRTERTAR